MPFVVIIVGMAIVIAAINGTIGKLGRLLREDIAAGFVWWLLAVVLIGTLGYFKTIRPVSNALLGLVLVAMFIANGGFFDKLSRDIKALTGPVPATSNQ